MDANEPSGSSRQGGGSIQPTDFSPANASLPNRPKLPAAPEPASSDAQRQL